MEAALKIIAFCCFGYNVSLVHNSIRDSSALQKSGHVTANKFIYCEGCLCQIQNWKFICRCSRAVQGSKHRFTAVVAYSTLLQQIILFRKEALLLANQDVVRNLKHCFVSLNENIAGHVRVGIFFLHLVKFVINQRLIETEQNVCCFPLSLPIFFLCHCEWIKIRILKCSALKATYYFLLWSCLIFWKWVSHFLLEFGAGWAFSLSSALQDKKTYCFTGKASLHNRRLPYSRALPSLLLALQGVMLLLSKVIQA